MAAIGASKNPDIAEAKREALLDEAIAAFRTMLIADPGLVRVRLELARAFFLKGEDTLATRHFEQVLARQAAGVGGAQRQPVPVSDAGAKALERARGHGAGAGQQYLQPVGRADDRARHPHRTASVYLSGGGRARIRYRHLGLGRRGIPVPAGGTAGSCARAATCRAGTTARGEFDQMTVSGHVGPRWLIDRVTDASLLANVRQNWLSDEAEFRDLGIRVEVRHRLNRRMTASLNASRHERRYDERTHLDGPLTDVSGASAGWRRRRCVSTRRGLGEPEDGTRARAQYAARVRLGVTAHLPWGFTVGGPARCAGPTTRPTGLHSSWAAGRAAT